MAQAPNLNRQITPSMQDPERVGLKAGRSGLKHWAGYISEEFLPELRGVRGYKIYDEMRKNEPTVVSMLLATDSIIQSVNWRAVAKDDTDGADLAAADHINKALERLNRPFDEIIADVCTMFPFGYALLEVTNKYQEGKVWWESLDLLGQDTLFRWEFDDRSNPVAFTQRPAPTYEEIRVPLEKCLHFRTRAEKNNPEGLSILRGAYKPYYYKKVIEEIEAMGAERDLLGIPIGTAPFGATPDEVAALQEIVESIKNDDQSGVVLTAVGPEQHQRFDIKLLTGQGSAGKVSYTDRLITRYAGEISMVAMAGFISMGKQSGGSYSLSSDTKDLFQVALKNWMGKIADVFNIIAIPNLLAMNGMTGKCHLEHGQMTQLNLQTISNFITSGVQNRFITVDRALEDFLRERAELPPLAKGTDAVSEVPEPAAPLALPPGVGDGAGLGVSTPGNPAAPPISPALPKPSGLTPGSKGNNSGLNSNPGQNQQTGLGPNAESKGAVKIQQSKAASELRIMLSELDDTDAWEEFSLKAISSMAGTFWEED